MTAKLVSEIANLPIPISMYFQKRFDALPDGERPAYADFLGKEITALVDADRLKRGKRP